MHLVGPFVAALVLGVTYFVLLHVYFGAHRTTPTLAGSRHPEPMASWMRDACRMFDAETLVLDQSHEEAWALLHAWNARDHASWRAVLAAWLEEKEEPLDAFDGVRALRLLMAGARVGFCTEETVWGAGRAIAEALSQRYASFSELTADCLYAWRRWARLPIDGHGDDAVCRRMVICLAGQWHGSPHGFRAFHRAGGHAQLPDIAHVRAALGAKQRASARATPPPLPSLHRCTFCRELFRGRPRACPSCGAPTGDGVTIARPALRNARQ